MNIKLLDNKLRTNASGISNIHRIIDAIVCIFIFSYQINNQINLILFSALIYIIISFGFNKMYGSYRSNLLKEIIFELISNQVIIIILIFILNFLIHYDSIFNIFLFGSKVIIFSLYVFISHIISRVILRLYRQKGGNRRTIMVKGDLSFFNLIEKEINSYPWMGYKIIKWFSSSETSQLDKKTPDGDNFDMIQWLKKNKPDQIFFAHENNDSPVDELLNLFGDTSISINYYSKWFNPSMKLKPINFGKSRLVTVWGDSPTLFHLFFKEIMDKTIAIFLLILLLPFLIIISILISISTKQNFLFVQNRVGKNGEIFKIYKFRTMKVSEDGEKINLEQAHKNDKRVTYIGRILRSYSIDELPQLFNVLNGSMSLVGPRPHAVSHSDFYRKKIKGYMQRHRLKPGITGLAQVKGFRGETKNLEDMVRRINYDLKYINMWSLSLDLQILFTTFFSIKTEKTF